MQRCAGLVICAFVDDRLEVVASPYLLDELGRVLRQAKFRPYLEERAAR